MRPNSASIPLNRIMEIRFLVKNITEKEVNMEQLWILIDDSYIAVDLMISEETVVIDNKSFHTIEFNSGFRKLVSTDGVSKMRRASEKVDAVLGE